MACTHPDHTSARQPARKSRCRQYRCSALLIACSVGLAAHTNDHGHELDEHAEPIVQLPLAYVPSDCHLVSLIAEAAESAGVPVGFESPDDDCREQHVRIASGGPEVPRASMGAAATLGHLVSLMPGYTLREMSGVVVIRRDDAWMDPNNALNALVKPFLAVQSGPFQILWRIFGVSATNAPSVGRTVSLSFTGGTRVDALNALVIAYGGLASSWFVERVDDSRKRVVLLIDGFTITHLFDDKKQIARP